MDWNEISAITAPPGRSGAAMASFSKRGSVLLHGGLDVGNSMLGDLWEFDGSNWIELTLTPSPGGRYDHAMVYDDERELVVLFGGDLSGPGSLWLYDGSGWTDHVTATVPEYRIGHAMAYDSSRGLIVMFGGWDLSTRFSGTWTYNGSNWSLLSAAQEPVPRTHHQMTYDAVRERVLLYGGFDENEQPLDDLWEFDGATWIPVDLDPRPNARGDHGFLYLPTFGFSLLACGSGGFSGSSSPLYEAYSLTFR